MQNGFALKARKVSMVEVIIVVRGSGTEVGKVAELCEDNLPREGSSKSGAVTLMPYIS